MVEERNTVSRLIPNSVLINETVENWTKSGDLVRLAVNVGVDYKADPKRVKDILESVCYEVERVSLEKRPQVLITAFNDSAVTMLWRFWVKNPKDGIRPVLSSVFFHILERFNDEGINIAFPQLDLHVKTGPYATTFDEEPIIRKRRKRQVFTTGSSSRGMMMTSTHESYPASSSPIANSARGVALLMLVDEFHFWWYHIDCFFIALDG